MHPRFVRLKDFNSTAPGTSLQLLARNDLRKIEFVVLARLQIAKNQGGRRTRCELHIKEMRTLRRKFFAQTRARGGKPGLGLENGHG